MRNPQSSKATEPKGVGNGAASEYESFYDDEFESFEEEFEEEVEEQMEEGELGNINKEIKEKQQKELEEKANGQSMASKLRIPE